MKNIADGYTGFSLDSPTRLGGKALYGPLGNAFSSGSSEGIDDEMVNQKVQVYGDETIFSYNYVVLTKDKVGKVELSLAKSTRVYVKNYGKWMLVHANFRVSSSTWTCPFILITEALRFLRIAPYINLSSDLTSISRSGLLQ